MGQSVIHLFPLFFCFSINPTNHTDILLWNCRLHNHVLFIEYYLRESVERDFRRFIKTFGNRGNHNRLEFYDPRMQTWTETSQTRKQAPVNMLNRKRKSSSCLFQHVLISRNTAAGQNSRYVTPACSLCKRNGMNFLFIIHGPSFRIRLGLEQKNKNFRCHYLMLFSTNDSWMEINFKIKL